MALANGDRVAYAQPVSAVSYANRDGNFVFGIICDATGVDVLWSNGTFAQGILNTTLDKIGDASSSNIGKVVNVSGAESPELTGIVVRVYSRQNNGAGAETSYTLIRLLLTGQLIEVPTSSVEPVLGR